MAKEMINGKEYWVEDIDILNSKEAILKTSNMYVYGNASGYCL